MPLGAATEAVVSAIFQLISELGGEAVRHYFGWKGCVVALVLIVGAAAGLYYLLT